ncbi:MAG: hypothetical protein GYA30_04545 [Chloroflexi bacterium]|nr:hypothetical protein [Chloroflexota bacterium]
MNIRHTCKLGMMIALFLALMSLSQSVTTAQAPAVALNGDVTAAAWSGFLYKFVAGSTLRPRASATTWASSGGGGCIYAVAGASEVFNVPLDLPQGSRIDYLRLYFYDTSASDSTAWVTIYDGAGGYVDVIGVNSSGTAGYGTTQSAYMGHIVNNSSNAYVLNWRPNVTGSTMMLCGLRVAYRLSLPYSVYLPLTLKNY